MDEAKIKAASDAVAALDGLLSVDSQDFDRERAHVEADNIILDFLRGIGADDVADAYGRVRACGFWYA